MSAPNVRDWKAGALRVRDWGGEGLPTLLLHGMAAHTHWWDSAAPLLAPALRAAAIDFRGHGDSDWTADGVYTAETWIDDVEAARAALGWDRFLLVGHSMGARVALGYAERHPNRLRGVVAIDFLAELREDRPSRFARLLRRPQPLYESEDAAVARFRLEPDGTTLPPERMRELGRLGVRRGPEGWSWKFDWRALSVRPTPIWPQLPRVRVPALLARGELTTIVSREDFSRMARELPGAREIEIPGAHHHVPLDAPAALAAAIAEFAAERTPR
jgi:pimeloyl-ACP methyl ester carboxylesterase